MPKKDVSTDTRLKDFWRENDHFADLATAIQSITKISSLFEISTKGVTNMNMCTALEKLKNEGIELGRNEGKTEILIQLVKEGLISFSDAAERLNISEDKFKALL